MISLETALSKRFTLPLLAYVLYKIYTDKPQAFTEPKEEYVPQEDALGVEIEPESKEFDWTKAYPIKYRPFKRGEYKLVMGIQNIPPSEWFLVESTYKEYTDLKWSYVQNPDLFDHNVFLNENITDVAVEFYTMATQFMLKRYPENFQVKGNEIHNNIRGDSIPLDAKSVKNPKDLMVYLSRTIEEDFILMVQDEKSESKEYVFMGGVFAFAAGFDPAERYMAPLTAIHGPVPEYRTKLKSQMNKFFDHLKPYIYVRRNNWSIQTHNKVFVMNDNKGTEDQEMRSLDPETLDFKREVFFRSERQILTRLPETGAIVFSIRTYLTPMADIRDEQSKGELIGGIEGMQEVIGQYKKKPEWGEPVMKYLRGETDGCDKPWIKGLA